MAKNTSMSAKAKISQKAVRRGLPLNGGPVGAMGGHKPNGTLEQQLETNANKPDITEGPRVTPREYIEDYHQRGYYAPKTGEVRTLRRLDDNGREVVSGGSRMLGQLSKASKNKK